MARDTPPGHKRRGVLNSNPEDEALAKKIVSPKRRRCSERKVTFACPFTKKDPLKYQDCYKYTLMRIQDVKQHIIRCHQVPPYCSRCLATFPSEELRDVHIRAMSCPERPFIKPEGVTESQRAQLTQKSASNLSQEDQWFVVFDILFPGHSPRAQSPYIDNELFQDITLYQDFVTTRGPQILSELLAFRGAVTWNLPNEEQDLVTFQNIILEEGLRTIFQQWANQNGLILANSSVHTSQSGRSMQDTPSSQSMAIMNPSRRVATLDENGEVEGETSPRESVV
ncbi:hypothetical protein GQ53DRAFT_801531 [Thozetella sp. PMI_491]|nr:hypothetical protein GQ53DRAFT_801531 [Thozetella sp. PMI_491]